MRALAQADSLSSARERCLAEARAGLPMPWLAAVEEAHRGTRVRASQYQRGYSESHPGGNCGIPHTRPPPALGRPRSLSDPGLGSGLARIRTCSDPSLRLNRLVDSRAKPPWPGHHYGRRDAPVRENRAVWLRVNLPPLWTERAVAAKSTRQISYSSCSHK
jgi:hypothetical protein